MQELLQGKYKQIEQLPKRQNQYLTFVVQKIVLAQKQEEPSQIFKKYIAKVEDLYDKRRDSKGKVKQQKKSRVSLALQQEIQILLDVERNIDKIGFPKAYDVYSLNDKRVLITDLRSLKLTKLIPLLLKNFSSIQYTKFCLKLIYDYLDRIESIHQANYIHEYLRPQFINFKKGDNNKDILFITDYTRAHKFNEYNIKKQNYHRPYQFSIQPSGKNGFASIWSHAKMSKSRRDDLQSFCYFCIYLLRGGQLPWSDAQFGQDQRKDKQIFQKKLKVIDSDIFQSQKQEQQTGFRTFMNFVQALSSKSQAVSKSQKSVQKIPKQIRQILIETRNLAFEQQPNYHYIRKILKKAMNRFQITETEDYDFPISQVVLYPKGF